MSESRSRSTNSVASSRTSVRDGIMNSRGASKSRGSSRLATGSRSSSQGTPVPETRSSSRSSSRSSNGESSATEKDDLQSCIVATIIIFSVFVGAVGFIAYMRCSPKTIVDGGHTVYIIPQPFEVVNETIIPKMTNIGNDTIVTNFSKTIYSFIKTIRRMCWDDYRQFSFSFLVLNLVFINLRCIKEKRNFLKTTLWFCWAKKNKFF